MCIQATKDRMEKSGTHISSQKPWGYNNKIQFSSLLKEAWEKAMIPTNICSGFRNAGIYPLNRDKIKPTIENKEGDTGNIASNITIVHNYCSFIYKYLSFYPLTVLAT